MTVNDYMQILLAVVSIWRRSWLALAFSILYLLHMAVGSHLSSPMYYLALILIDAAVALSISAFTPSRRDIFIAGCCGIFMLVNCYGLAIWWLCIPPTSYDYACTAAYITMITTIISTGNPAHERRQRDDGRLGCSGAWLALREGLGLHYKEGGS